MDFLDSMFEISVLLFLKVVAVKGSHTTNRPCLSFRTYLSNPCFLFRYPSKQLMNHFILSFQTLKPKTSFCSSLTLLSTNADFTCPKALALSNRLYYFHRDRNVPARAHTSPASLVKPARWKCSLRATPGCQLWGWS